MRTTEKDLIARHDIPNALWLAKRLREEASLSVHEIAADELERLHKQLESLKVLYREMETTREEAYKEGRRHALYEVRNAINEKFGL